MRTLAAALFALMLLVSRPSRASALDDVKQEPNPERRSELAMDNANTALDRARDLFQSSQPEQARAAVVEVGASVDLASDSLRQSGKDARRSPKYFKKAELASRQLLRRIEGLKQSVDFEDQTVVERLREHVSAFHDELIRSIMGRKK